jgi:hypothetical protein
MLKIAAVASEREILGALPTELRGRLRERHGLAARRINRYIALALCGALRCRDAAGGIAPDAALYLACDSPMASSTVHVLHGILDEGRAPTPFEFMNLVGNMAGFCIGEQLGLRGPQLALSRVGAGFEAALELLALRSAPHRRALLGYVDEGVWPLAEHRRRLHRPENAPLAEGSHWLYVDADCARPLARVAGARHRDCGAAREALRGLPPDTALAFGDGIAGEDREAWRRALAIDASVADDDTAYSPVDTAHRLVRFVEDSRAAHFLHLAAARDGSVYALRAQRG